LRARIDLKQTTSSVHAGSAFVDRLVVCNTGSVTWKARGRRFGGQVTCGLKVCDGDGQILREDLGRTSLPHDVPPGGEAALEMQVIAQGLAVGRYTLRYDLVVEGVTWFEFQGSECVERPLEVTM
jgi:hypothetical protein